MPEGDTILRAARTLARALEGRTVLAARSTVPALTSSRLSGRKIERIEARGKNLLFHFDDGRVLHSHMRMTGSWHLYRPGERWRKPERFARLVLETDAFVAVCFHAPVIELLSARSTVRHPSLSRLGGDILAENFDAAAAAAAIRSMGSVAIGEALLHQGAVAGIGNIYKSESLFAAKLDPFIPVSALPPSEIERVLLLARGLMQASLGPAASASSRPGSTRGSRVYRRAGKACASCGTSIRMRRQGDAGRSTYWCPHCQQARARTVLPGDPIS
ncbi:MAG: Fpg/Nei family DNA glycosylase [Acidobacteriota bacterium]|nr:Fpg/Nei family DNA glycosylase [Acidobacteriota bacterium]